MAIRRTYPSIVVGGHDITECVHSYELRQSAGDLPTMTVELALPDVHDIVEHPAVAEHARVLLDDETRAALVALGWTPPEE